MASRKPGHRKVSVTDNPMRLCKRPSVTGKRREDVAKLIKFTDDGISSKNVTFCGPYGKRKVCYCDFAENGRCLSFIEEFLVKEVVPLCGDETSASNITSIQSSFFKQEAKDICRRCVNATEEDALMFIPRGRSPLETLIQLLCVQEPVVVFVSSCAGESALSPWKPVNAKIVKIAETKEGVLDLDDLEAQLVAHQGWGQLIGCFTAASLVTGLLADDIAATLLLRQHGALSFWDFTAAGAHTAMDMNPTVLEASPVYKDAMFFAVDKFLGGAMTPSVLVVKNKLFQHSHSVLHNLSCGDSWLSDCIPDRTDVVECARAGLVMQLKETIGEPAVLSRQEKIIRTVLTHIRTIPELLLLGNYTICARLPIFSFVVRHPRGAYLHHNFLSAVLNDVFGIQARSYPAEPYAASLLGIGPNFADELNCALRDRNGSRGVSSSQVGLRPGYTQFCLPYALSDNELAFILEALKMAATEAWKLLPQYVFNPQTGEWRHYSGAVMKDRKILNSVRFLEGKLVLNERKISSQNSCPTDYADCLHVARCIFNKARKMAQRFPLAEDSGGQSQRMESSRWFMLPCEAQDLLLGRSQNVKQAVPFSPLHRKGVPCDSVDVETPLRAAVPPSPTSLSHSLHQIFNPPKATFIIGSPEMQSSRQRCNSLGSALLRGRAGAGLTLPYSRCSLPDGEPLSDSNTNSEELQAYVSEVTRELATEIKSELREVISTVEQCPRSRLERTDSFTSASASDIAEYLMGVSREMAKEMKTELRELVSSVTDQKTTPDQKRVCDRVRRQANSESRDSGINLSWSPELRQDYDRSESLDSVDTGETQIAITSKRKNSRVIKKYQDDSSSTTSTTSEESCEDVTEATERWQCPPKTIWKPVIEAVDELRMINEGDSVLVNLMCENSEALLHVLHQLQLHKSSKGIHFSLAALTATKDDPRLLALGVQSIPITGSEGRLCGCGLTRAEVQALGASRKFTVLALGDSLDDFAENFLLSVFHSGRLKTLKAQTCPSEHNVRVIRPFVYVRAKHIEEFVESKKLSRFYTHCKVCLSRNQTERKRFRSWLAQQEDHLPQLFTSIRSALHPLIGTKYTSVGYITDSDELTII